MKHAPEGRTGESAKRNLRARVRAARAARTPAERAAVAASLAFQASTIPRWSVADCVGSYLALPGEPDCAGIHDLLADAGGTVLLPRLKTDSMAPAEARFSTARMQFAAANRGPHGRWNVARGTRTPSGQQLIEPTGPPLPANRAQVLLVPTTAVDRRGGRLGQGGGFYDRVLGSLPSSPRPLLVAVVHDDEVLDDVPVAAHDVRMDGILTPSGYRPATG